MIGITGGSAAGIGSWRERKADSAEQSGAREDFSAMLEKMKKGQSPGADSDDGSDPEKTVTVTRIMSDGSTLITVMREGKIVSQSRTHAVKAEENLRVLDTITQVGADAGAAAAALQTDEGADGMGAAGSAAGGYFGGTGMM